MSHYFNNKNAQKQWDLGETQRAQNQNAAQIYYGRIPANRQSITSQCLAIQSFALFTTVW